MDLSFFFQAEDGIRDRNVTGVQTCALPISNAGAATSCAKASAWTGWPCLLASRPSISSPSARAPSRCARSEERRVGKEWRSRWWTEYRKEKKQIKSKQDITRKISNT